MKKGPRRGGHRRRDPSRTSRCSLYTKGRCEMFDDTIEDRMEAKLRGLLRYVIEDKSEARAYFSALVTAKATNEESAQAFADSLPYSRAVELARFHGFEDLVKVHEGWQEVFDPRKAQTVSA